MKQVRMYNPIRTSSKRDFWTFGLPFWPSAGWIAREIWVDSKHLLSLLGKSAALGCWHRDRYPLDGNHYKINRLQPGGARPFSTTAPTGQSSRSCLPPGFRSWLDTRLCRSSTHVHWWHIYPSLLVKNHRKDQYISTYVVVCIIIAIFIVFIVYARRT